MLVVVGGIRIGNFDAIDILLPMLTFNKCKINVSICEIHAKAIQTVGADATRKPIQLLNFFCVRVIH